MHDQQYQFMQWMAATSGWMIVAGYMALIGLAIYFSFKGLKKIFQ